MSVSDERKALVSYTTRLQVFIYILLRDHLPFGVVEKTLLDHVNHLIGVPVFCEPGGQPLVNGQPVEDYALDLADRILRQRLAPFPAENKTIHILRAGRPLCRFTGASASEWPVAHGWIQNPAFGDRIDAVTCAACVTEWEKVNHIPER